MTLLPKKLPLPLWLAVFGVLRLCASCTDTGGTPTVQSTASDVAKDTAADSGPAAVAETVTVADSANPPAASCVGSSLQEGFAARDSDCAFLEKCASLGKCYCGDKCPASKSPKCDASLCSGSQPKCHCGEGCAAGKKKCPAYICDPIDEKNCQELDDCTFVNTAPPSWCGCQKMPAHQPDCWCGAKNCTEPKPECAAGLCAGKNPDKCIYVKGEDYTTCWCDTCGLFGDKAKCFFVLCPNG